MTYMLHVWKKKTIFLVKHIYVYILMRMLLMVPVENFSKIKMKIEDRTYYWCNWVRVLNRGVKRY